MPLAQIERSMFRLSGAGLYPWLDGLITNNLSNPLSFSALLTPQGKIIADFFITHDGNDLLIDCAPKFADPLRKRLKIYKLREKIDITDISAAYNLYVLWDGAGDLGHIDPRSQTLGRRLLTADIIETSHSEADYNAHRLRLGVPDSHYDFETETMFPADANMDLINGVDFKKGCFVGQEVVSRMKRKTTVRKRMRSIMAQAPLAAGPILSAERVIGDCLYAQGDIGMALIRLDRLAETSAPPSCGGVEIKILESSNPGEA